MEHSEQQGSNEIKISIHFLIPFPVTASRALRVPVMLQLIPGVSRQKSGDTQDSSAVYQRAKKSKVLGCYISCFSILKNWDKENYVLSKRKSALKVTRTTCTKRCIQAPAQQHQHNCQFSLLISFCEPTSFTLDVKPIGTRAISQTLSRYSPLWFHY